MLTFQVAMRFLLFCLFIFAPFFAVFANAAELTEYRADVSAVRHGTVDIKARGEMVFELDQNGRWQNWIEVKGRGLTIEEHSSGRRFNNEFRPTSYDRLTRFLFYREPIQWSFDWRNMVIAGEVKKDDYQYDIDDTVHDPLSFQLEVRRALQQGETTFTYQYMRYNRPQELVLEVIGEELLELADERVHTLIIQQIKPARSSERRLIWVTKNWGFVPVRYATYDDGKIKDDIFVTQLWVDGEKVLPN